MNRLTDIKSPNAYFHDAPKPPRQRFLKRFFKGLFNIIFAPFIWPFKIVIAITRGLKKLVSLTASLLIAIVLAVKNFFVAFWLKIKTLPSLAFAGFSGFFGFFGKFLPNNWAGWLVLLLTVGLLFQLSITTNILPFLNFPKIDSNKLQAVFLANGQVYFGHLKKEKGNYTTLENVYYLRTPAAGQTATNLVKLGSELHGPENTMFIPNTQISFWENLKNDSQVVQLIKQLESSR